MADTVTSQTIQDGERVAIMKFTNVSDGTGESAVKKVDCVIYTGERFDETSDYAHYFAPNSHYLESWDVLNPSKGDYGFVQPTINRLFKTRQWQESLLKWSGDNQDFDQYVRLVALSILGSESSLIDAIHDGFVSVSNSETEESSASGVITSLDSEAVSDDSATESSNLTNDLLSNAVEQASVDVSGNIN